MANVPPMVGIVLAGGQSKRMGQDKAQLRLDDFGVRSLRSQSPE